MDLIRCLAGAAIAGAISLLAPWARAQIVNVQPIIAEKEKANGMAGALEGAADVRSGNTRTVQLSGMGIVEVRSGRHLAFALLRGEFGEKAGDPFLNKDLEHLRYRIEVAGPVSAEAFIQHDRDDFRRLALRALVGVGPQLSISPSAGLEGAVGAAFMIEYERLASGPEPDAGERVLDERLSTYLFVSTSVAPRLKLADTIYVQPRLSRFKDIRVLHDVSLMAAATEHISVKLSMTSAFDSEPPKGVIPLDVAVKSALQVGF